MSAPFLPVIIWIDRSHARLLSFDQTFPREQSFLNQSHDGHQFMDLLVSKLEGATRILIVGPGVTKYRFFSFVRETAPQIARKVVGCIELDQPHDFRLRNLAELHLGVVSNPTEV